MAERLVNGTDTGRTKTDELEARLVRFAGAARGPSGVRAILDLIKSISTMLAAVSRRLRGDRSERLWDSGPPIAHLKLGGQLLQADIPRLVGG